MDKWELGETLPKSKEWPVSETKRRICIHVAPTPYKRSRPSVWLRWVASGHQVQLANAPSGRVGDVSATCHNYEQNSVPKPPRRRLESEVSINVGERMKRMRGSNAIVIFFLSQLHIVGRRTLSSLNAISRLFTLIEGAPQG